MLGLKSKIILGAFGVATIGSIIGLGYRHYVGLVDQVGQLESEKAQLETSLAVQDATIADQREALLRWLDEAEAQEKRLGELQAVAQSATEEARRLNDIFAEHDLTRLTLARPGLIERRINSGTADIGRVLECASAGNCGDNE